MIGSSIATAVAGPMPGSTPTAVPIVQPSSAHSRLIGVPAVTKPCSSWFQMSIGHEFAIAQSQPVAVRPGRLIASSCVNIQYTGAAIAKPMAASTSQARATPGRAGPRPT